MHPWTDKFLQCLPSLAEACKNIHVDFDQERAQAAAMAEDWLELEKFLLSLGHALAKRNSIYARSLDTLVWALYQVFPYKSG